MTVLTHRLTVRHAAGSYPVVVTPDDLAGLGPLTRELLGVRRIALVTDENVARFHLEAAEHALRGAGHSVEVLVLPPGEANKTPASLEHLWLSMASLGFDRGAVVCALGGGIVGDVAGLCAATWHRGVDLVQVPTTLLAQVDSSVGGKTAVNLGGTKNVIGAFHPPRLVYASLATLTTLPVRELRAGLGEVVKHAVIGRPELLSQLEAEAEELVGARPQTLAPLVAACIEVKRDIVERDEREAGPRQVLNFGHTFGHAIETVTNHALLHGEAVAVGMVAACRLAEALGLSTPHVRTAIVSALRACELPHDDRAYWTQAVLNAILRDKKVRGGQVQFVIAADLGHVATTPIDLDVLHRFFVKPPASTEPESTYDAVRSDP